MLTEERPFIILDTVNKNKNVELGELCKLLNTSESTVRRDLGLPDKKGLFVKVRGGAIAAADESFTAAEPNAEEKAGLSTPDKNEASVKTMAVSRSKEVFILGDHSKCYLTSKTQKIDKQSTKNNTEIE